LGWQASYAPTDSEKRQCEEAATKSGHKTEECKTIWERTTTDPVAFFTFWLVVFTGGLGISTVLLWRAGEKQFRHARRSAAIQSRDMQASTDVSKRAADAAMISAQVSKAAIRAIITIPNYTATRHHSNDGVVFGYAFEPNIENAGTTHAVNFRIVCSVALVAVDDTETRFAVPEYQTQTSSIGLGTKVNPSQPSMLSLNDAMRIWRGESKFLIWCRIGYDDVMGEPHHTETCVKVCFRDDPSLMVRDADFVSYQPDGPHNTAS
jgi:hypothetical protein